MEEITIREINVTNNHDGVEIELFFNNNESHYFNLSSFCDKSLNFEMLQDSVKVLRSNKFEEIIYLEK